MKSKVKALVAAATLLVFSNMQAISQDCAKWWGVGTGIVTGVAVGVGTHLFLIDAMRIKPGQIKDCFWYYSDGNKKTINYITPLVDIAAGIGVGALTGYLVYKYLLTQTPQARYLVAKTVVQTVLADNLIETQFKTDEEMIKYINVRFGTGWPLVLARSFFEGTVKDLSDVNRILQSAEQEARKDIKQSRLCKKCEELQAQIPVIIDLIANKMNVIIQNYKIDYQFQLKLHQNYIEEMRRLEQERREKERDRWHQYNMHSDKIHQKEKDRKLKQDALNAQQGNVAVSVNL